MGSIAREVNTTGPVLARSHVETLTNSELNRVDSIVWSREEYRVAFEASFTAADMSDDEQNAWLSAPGNLPGLQGGITVADGAPFLPLYELKWFNERYLAHASAIATLHFIRFNAIRLFLGNYYEQLIEDGWLTPAAKADAYAVDISLLDALVSIAYERGAVFSELTVNAFPRFGYEHVNELAGLIDTGDITIEPFVRTPYDGPESVVYKVDFESTGRSVIDPDLLGEGLAFLAAARGGLAGEFSHLRDAIREQVPDASDASIDMTLMSMWGNKQGMDEDTAKEVAVRIAAVAEFLDDHEDLLVQDGLAKRTADGITLNRPLLMTLAQQHLEVPEGYDGLPKIAYRSVRAMASTFMQLKHFSNVARQAAKAATPAIGRNDPCPCGSGRKFKKCCGARPRG